MSRPSRKNKVINYCEAKDFDDDDDFVHSRGPPSKKTRENEKQEQKGSSSRSSSQETNSQSSQKESRKPLSEKLFDRDLEAAITLSLLNNTDGLKEQRPTSKAEVKVKMAVDENTDPISPLLSNCSVDTEVMGLNRISADKETPPRPRNPASKSAQEDDDDYQPKLTPDSQSDEDYSDASESESEEFTVKMAAKTKKKEKATKKEKNKTNKKQPSKASKSKSSAAESTPVRSPPTSKFVPVKPSSSSVSIPKPPASHSPAGGRIPKWNPPAQIGRSPSSSTSPAVKSPGQGLRLGLSRLVRVKPLHPSH